MVTAEECLEEVCKELLSKVDELNELDEVMGDGEHGSNIKRTFTKVQEILPLLKGKDTATVLDQAGTTLLIAGGGTATTLIGFAGKKIAALLKSKKNPSTLDIATVLDSTWKSIYEKSKANVGDKTLMDAFTPAVKAFKEGAEQGATLGSCLELAAAAAEQGSEATKNMIAKRGRGYYVGERGLGTKDPGSVTVATIFKAISTVYNK